MDLFTYAGEHMYIYYDQAIIKHLYKAANNIWRYAVFLIIIEELENAHLKLFGVSGSWITNWQLKLSLPKWMHH